MEKCLEQHKYGMEKDQGVRCEWKWLLLCGALFGKLVGARLCCMLIQPFPPTQRHKVVSTDEIKRFSHQFILHVEGSSSANWANQLYVTQNKSTLYSSKSCIINVYTQRWLMVWQPSVQWRNPSPQNSVPFHISLSLDLDTNTKFTPFLSFSLHPTYHIISPNLPLSLVLPMGSFFILTFEGFNQKRII